MEVAQVLVCVFVAETKAVLYISGTELSLKVVSGVLREYLGA